MSKNDGNNGNQHAQHTLCIPRENKKQQHSFTAQPPTKQRQASRTHDQRGPRSRMAGIDDAKKQAGHNDICGTQTFL